MKNRKTNSDPTLIADIGGTNARFAVAQGGQIAGEVMVLACQDYEDLASATNAFLHSVDEAHRPRRGMIAVAAPVFGESIQLTNLNWAFSRDQLRQDLQMDALNIINDFTAITWAVPRLQESERRQIGPGQARSGAPIVIIGPGSGLGVAALIPLSNGWTALPTEGGHVTMAASNAMEDKVLDILRQKFGHVSAERVLSGPGLVNIYTAIIKVAGQPFERLSPEQLTAQALAQPESQAAKALEMFFAFLGTAASNAALSLDAHGGVYIAGGIVAKLDDAISASRFRQRFETKGRFSGYLSPIPTFVIDHPYVALAGLAAGPLA